MSTSDGDLNTRAKVALIRASMTALLTNPDSLDQLDPADVLNTLNTSALCCIAEELQTLREQLADQHRTRRNP